MRVQAEISLYPLRERDLLPSIEEFVSVLREQGLDLQMGAMSTLAVGESSVLFRAIEEAFERVAAHGACVLIGKYSNACPPPLGRQESQGGGL
jgi:uncharacterized protein YqgV (UPF0045/DUF77 family)